MVEIETNFLIQTNGSKLKMVFGGSERPAFYVEAENGALFLNAAGGEKPRFIIIYWSRCITIC